MRSVNFRSIFFYRIQTQTALAAGLENLELFFHTSAICPQIHPLLIFGLGRPLRSYLNSPLKKQNGAWASSHLHR